MVRTEAGKPLLSTNSFAAEGTVLTSVTGLLVTKWGNCSTFSARITVPPLHNGTKISKTERSKQIEVEAKTPAKSSEVKILIAQCVKATVLQCSIATPFGRPV